jgi:valyl-tRNA synthetase
MLIRSLHQTDVERELAKREHVIATGKFLVRSALTMDNRVRRMACTFVWQIADYGVAMDMVESYASLHPREPITGSMLAEWVMRDLSRPLAEIAAEAAQYDRDLAAYDAIPWWVERYQDGWLECVHNETRRSEAVDGPFYSLTAAQEAREHWIK